MGTLLIGYDVEYWEADGTTPSFLERARQVHERWDAPATLFLLGRTLELHPQEVRRAVTGSVFDVGQHTYTHQLFKTLVIEHLDPPLVVRGAPPDVVEDEVRRTTELIADVLGLECVGLTAPWTYYRGLRDRPDVLEVLWRQGIRWLRSDGRDAHDWQPAPMTQPYWYAVSGYPDMLEMPTHGWHDCVVRESVLGWDDLTGYVDLVTTYLDRAAEEDLVLSLCAHDWSSVRGDPDLWHVEEILRRARMRGLTLKGYGQEYRERAAARVPSAPGHPGP